MYQDDERVLARKRQAEQAIQLAMANRWEDAVVANRAILDVFPNDADSYNRLGKALMELGRYPAAKKAYKKALELDGTNQIAKKNLERLNVLAKAGGTQTETAQVDPALFIEEMGKTTLTILEQPASDALAKLHAGERVELRRQGDSLAVETVGGELIGTVEPKLRLRLLKLMDGGNKYAAAITSLRGDECQIIIKETYQDPSQAGRPSFPTAIAAERTRPYTKDSLLHYGTQVEELEQREPTVEGDDESDDSGGETVVQEGHIRLNDAVAAEEASEEEPEE